MSPFTTRSPPDHPGEEIEHRAFMKQIKITILFVVGCLAMVSCVLLIR
jgi:hypothetical protein